jgi:GAF domain-containing protein
MSLVRFSGREVDPDLEDIAWLAAEIGAAPVAVVGLIEGTPPVFRCAARLGAGAAAAESVSGCVKALVREGVALAVPDLHAEARFAGDPVLAPPLQARAFAAAPIPSAGGPPLGAVAVFDLEARPFLPWQVRALGRLAALAGRRLEAAQESRARDLRREQTLGALAGGLALEIQALQSERAGGSLARAAALARDLLALSGHRSLRPAPLDLNALVAARAAHAADTCGRRLEIRLDRTIGPVAADGERLGRAIAGLVARAAATVAGTDPGAQAMRLRTAEVAIEAGPPAPLPAGRYVLLTIGASQPENGEDSPSMDGDPMRVWSFDATDAPGLAELRGLLRQSGARLGTAIGASGLPAFCIALPRAAD